MARKTRSDVEDKIERLNRGWTNPGELTFECYGGGGNSYILMDTEGNAYGRTYNGSREFLAFLDGFGEGRRL